jgi:hypothetical protein
MPAAASKAINIPGAILLFFTIFIAVPFYA